MLTFQSARILLQGRRKLGTQRLAIAGFYALNQPTVTTNAHHPMPLTPLQQDNYLPLALGCQPYHVAHSLRMLDTI